MNIAGLWATLQGFAIFLVCGLIFNLIRQKKVIATFIDRNRVCGVLGRKALYLDSLYKLQTEALQKASGDGDILQTQTEHIASIIRAAKKDFWNAAQTANLYLSPGLRIRIGDSYKNYLSLANDDQQLEERPVSNAKAVLGLDHGVME